MKRRLKPLVWPVALLIAAGLTALLAEATTRSVETVTLYGMVKLVSDLVLVIGATWLVAGLFSVVRPRTR
jgi:membrane-bound ClpP family serine protease